MSSETAEQEFEIKVATSGFFKGLNKSVAVSAIVLTVVFLAWVLLSASAGDKLTSIQLLFSKIFGAWYIYVSAFYLLTCLALALWPRTAKVNLGQPGEKPEFSRFSWFSMMFGAGLGVGMLTYAVGEPVFHFQDNPDVIKGLATGLAEDNVRPAFKWTLLHYGLTAWAIYGTVGLAMAYFSYNRGLPLTIRSGLQPLFGKTLSGPIGHVVDITAIIATITGVGYTIALGVKQFAFGMHNVTGANWIIPDGASEPILLSLLLALAIIMFASILSAISGVGKGIKWLSNINMSLSIFLLLFFAVLGAFSGALLFGAKHYVLAIYDYIIALPSMSFTVWGEGTAQFLDDGSKVCANTECTLATWQGPWTILYWAWWIAFAPFVGLFLARVSRGRSIREFVLGAMIMPSLMCLVWFALAGGSAIFAELSGKAKGSIVGSDLSAQLFETINVLLSSGSMAASFMSVIIVILLITYLVTSADSAILVISTIASGGKPSRSKKHVVFWGMLLSAVVGVLLAAGGLGALRAAMLIGALPFSLVVALMAISLIKALIQGKNSLNS